MGPPPATFKDGASARHDQLVTHQCLFWTWEQSSVMQPFLQSHKATMVVVLWTRISSIKDNRLAKMSIARSLGCWGGGVY